MKVYFVGAGPGDPRLITVRGKELLEGADLVVYAGSLVNPQLLDYAGGAQLVDSHGMELEDIVDCLAGAARRGERVVRLHSGDPSLWGAIVEQIDLLEQQDITVEIVPGVSSAFASAAALRTQLTLKGVSEALVITRPQGKTLEEDLLPQLSGYPVTLAIYLGVHKIREVMSRVSCPGDTPVAVVYRASWPEERVIRGTVADIADKVEEAGITSTAMIIVGGVVDPEDYGRSVLYGSR